MVDVTAASKWREEVQRGLPTVRVGLLHGKMSGDEKAETLTAFKSGNMRVLVATSIVEVGMDVPEATIMIVENA
eukprot:CAMPEP_0118947758 /NCGR_PEP_ID=MMETSP1169-20130426/46610_1 /TAXON_ID=36882 /ORGANISM="Pyramimonas obovata, Strain CCMP722" /LENGTH=73 /DNA_ID=CAMNT_0006894035 /DNA_START=1 /DNA_END=219 /DNA_ORIENTATION=+